MSAKKSKMLNINQAFMDEMGQSLIHGKFKKVFSMLEPITEFPANAAIGLLTFRAWSRFQLGIDIKTSIRELEIVADMMQKQASGFQPEYLPLRYLIELYIVDNQYDKARELITIVLEKNNKDEIIWGLLAYLHFFYAEYHAAKYAYQQVINFTKDKNQVAVSNFRIAYIDLCLGNYDIGFKAYENRHDIFPTLEIKGIEHKHWQGQELKNKTIIVLSEQGFGDVICFARYFSNLEKKGAKVIFLLNSGHQRIEKLCKGIIGISEIRFAEQYNLQVEEFDYYISLMSLPGILGLPESNRKAKRFLTKVPRIKKFDLIKKNNNLKIGLCWSSVTNPEQDKNSLIKKKKQLELKQLIPLLKLKQSEFISLQIIHAEVDEELMQKFKIMDLSDKQNDFSDTAALIKKLNIVITIDTAVAHLAGALGKPTWILLPLACDWRWQLNREDSIWYESVKLFRQTNKDDWGSVIERVVHQVGEINKKSSENK